MKNRHIVSFCDLIMQSQPEFLKNKIILITGGAKGLGRHLSINLAKQGAVVATHYNTSQKEAGTLLRSLKKYSPSSDIFQADLRSPGQTEQMFLSVLDRYGRIDVLINNVGNFIYKPFEKVSFEDFRDVTETNLYATFLCSKIAAKKMKKQKNGDIINFGCAGADRMIIRELTTPYYIAKSGVIQLTKIFASAYARYGVRINAISPGILKTSVAKLSNLPTGQYSSFDDILNALLFLLSPQSSYINGANIEVAGGWNP